MTEKYCPACGATMDADGICTNTKCARRTIQLKLKKAKDRAAQAERQ